MDVFRDGDKWVAVVPELLVVGNGPDAAAAAQNAITRAEAAEKALVDNDLAVRNEGKPLRIRGSKSESLGRAALATLAGFGVRSAVVGAILLVFYLFIAQDVKTIAREVKNDLIAQVSLFRNAVEGTAGEEQNVPQRLQARAERLRQILSPAAKELRPLFRLLVADDLPAETK
jgi:hypothetical protein